MTGSGEAIHGVRYAVRLRAYRHRAWARREVHVAQVEEESAMEGRVGLPVLVGVDGSAPSLRALRLAAAEAALRGTALRVVYVREPAHWARRGTGEPAGAAAEAAAEAAYRHVASGYPGLDVAMRVVEGLPATVLIAESGGAGLTVLGQRGCGGYLGLAAGSVCTQVATRGHGSVVVARGDAAAEWRAPVLVAVDAHAPAAEAIEFAFAEAALRDVALLAIYVPAGRSAAVAPAGGVEAAERSARLLAEAMADGCGRYPDVKVEPVVEGAQDAPAVLLARSAEAGLIVVGPHDRSPLRRLVLGAVGATLVHRARCPVAVVHPRSEVEHDTVAEGAGAGRVAEGAGAGRCRRVGLESGGAGAGRRRGGPA